MVVLFFGYAVSFLFMGPSKWLNFPNKLYSICIGFFLIGFFEVFVFLPCFPEMAERLQVGLEIPTSNKFLYGKMNDRINDCYGFIFACTNTIAPLAGTWIQAAVKGRTTMDIHAAVFLGMGIFVFVFNCGPNFISENKQF